MLEWEKVRAENIVRHKSGCSYLRAESHGKIIRLTLRTDNLRITEIKHDSSWPCFGASLRSTAAEPISGHPRFAVK